VTLEEEEEEEEEHEEAVEGWIGTIDKNSSGDEIANMNFFYNNIVHVEASAYAH